jgi:transposase
MAVPSSRLEVRLAAEQKAAFEAFGGAPAEILYDRMRTVFSREDLDAGHIVYNRTLVEFARHYGFLPKACQAYRAKTKGEVERPFRYICEDPGSP